MELSWLGGCCFRLRGKDVAIVVDPLSAMDPAAVAALGADVILLSRAIRDPATRAALATERHVVEGAGEYEIQGTLITGVATPRPPEEPLTVPRNTAYVVSLDDVTVCHLGQLATLLTAEQVAVVKDADVLLLPIGGSPTIDATRAAEVVSQVEPHLVVPMGFAADEAGVAAGPVDRFGREIGATDLRPQPRLSVTRGSLPDQLTVVLLEPRK